MKIDLGTLNNKEIQSTGESKKMKLSDNVGSIIFQMFTSNIYSNPIGSIVREITSNAVDSHIAADVDTPVIVRLGYDENTKGKYISIIDYGVGMSPKLIDDVYTVYFESTKRDSNDEIGGFGIGGKTPLAYKRMVGSGEYDNSFFLITNYNGVKYFYNIYEGQKSPEYILLHKEETNEHNGTEVRIPVLHSDIYKFETEIIKQLYYFDNIVFEGFSDRIQNDYKIYKGKTFLYRGNDISHYVHVCLGKVAYPIDYSILGLDATKFSIPVAVNVPIGKINVVTSREHLDYSEETIKYLKEKLIEVVDELKTMLAKQHNNIITLSDYFNHKKNVFKLEITKGNYIDLGKVINFKEIELKNFQYKGKLIPSFSHAFNHFFTVKRHGAVEKKKYYNETYPVFYKKYDDLNNGNVFYADENFRITRKLKSYLIKSYGRIYILRKKIDINYTDEDLFFTFKLKKAEETSNVQYLKKIHEDYWSLIKDKVTNLNDIEIPEDFSISNADLKKRIPVTFNTNYIKEKLYLKDLLNFKGVIFYTTIEHEELKEQAYNLFKHIYPNRLKHVVGSYSYYRTYKFGKDTNIMFISLAKNNVRYLKHHNNAHNLKEDNYFYFKFLLRKEYDIVEYMKYAMLYKELQDINNLFTKEVMKDINKKIYDVAQKVIKLRNTVNSYNFDSELFRYKYSLQTFGVKLNEKLSPNQLEYKKNIEKLNEVNDKNYEVLKYINIPFYDFNDTIKDILKKVLVF